MSALLFVCLQALLCCAWAKVEVTMHDSTEVYLGDLAPISCQYSFTDVDTEPSDVIIQWFVGGVGSSSRSRIFYGDDSQTMVDENTDYSGRIQVTSDKQASRLVIQEARLTDEKEFFCQINGMVAGSAEGKTHLRVFAPPQAPVIEGVLTGISVTNEGLSEVASCETLNGFPKPNITWYRNNTPLMTTPGHVNVLMLGTRDSGGFYSVQSTLRYKVLKEDKDARFSCEVSFFVPGAIRTVESSSINITVHYPTTMVELWKESPQGLVKEGDTVELRCQGDGSPPPSFIFNREQEPDVDLGDSGDILLLTSVTRKDGGIYQCRPQDVDGASEVRGEMQLNVHFLDPAVVVPKESELMLRGEDLIATCNALSSLKTSTVWYKDGQQVSHGNMLQLKDATYDTAGEYICDVTVPSLPALHTHGSIHIIVQGAPQMVGMEQEVQLEEAVGRTVNLSCEVQSYPRPVVSWNIVGSQSWQEVVNKASDHMTQSVVSVLVGSDVSALCNASNEMGSEVKLFSIRAIPRVTSATRFSPVEGSGVIIVVIILCLLLLAVLGSVLYFLQKKGKLPCGRSGKQEISTKETNAKNEIVVEMKTNTRTEESVLLKAVNGDKKDTGQQMTV
ncbi:cell surface glycoprotein MUC18 isoform X1 [Takifugu rubripes]|uniref:cell surface glycoprotein MUC18 isoform X1 n=1 Tax=Takifugu rubripes TaxID=31033 RepID=UPI0005D1E5DA|nr:cell surface glycoprotein MUC18-like isoform X1 [Takifugu rubripes]|eukprot:XP_011609548.1 PREDICTED: cell surface glycoprotein MUC18-like isoform X1 [Takifugu rubripes]